ncbi:MAG: IPT/TIG domain-containing protein [Chloroflexota bacterium]|nr:IPT/TIG domain-containing protein [Chloroflexota bacterium]
MSSHVHRYAARLLAALLLLLLALPLGPATTVRAAGTTYYVGSLIDDAGIPTGACINASNTTCTLRDILAIAGNGDTIHFDAYASSGAYRLGTGANQGTLTITHSVTIAGPGSDKVAIDGGFNVATHTQGTIVFMVNSGVTATIRADFVLTGPVYHQNRLPCKQKHRVNRISNRSSGLEITHGNNQNVGGGGIYSLGTLILTNDLIDHNNTLDIGGGVDSDGGTSVTVTGCTFIGNTAGSYGGGISVTFGSASITNSTFSTNSAMYGGGGIYFEDSVPSSVTNSTLTANSVTAYGGGGIYIFNGYITLANDTIVNNSAVAPGGGGIYDGGQSLTITSSTIAMNHVNANGVGGGILSAGFAPVTVANAIIANNDAGNCARSAPTGGITDGGHNLQFGDASCGVTIPVNDPLLDPGGLSNNGGPTQTIALLPGSPAIDAVPATGANCPTTDQRGIARPQPTGGACDSGAYEYVPVRATVTGMYAVGTAGQTIRLTGTGFQRGSQVLVDGTPLLASAVTKLAPDGTALTVALPSHVAGAVTLTVANPGGLTSAATGNLTYQTPTSLPPPRLTTTPIPGKTPPPLPSPRSTVAPAPGGPPRPLPPSR